MSDGDRKDAVSLPGGLSAEQLQNAVQSITSDPAFGKLLGELGMKGTGEQASSAQIPAVTPEMMAKLPEMMAALAPLVSGGRGGGEKSPPAAHEGEKKADLRDTEKRKKLLNALKPYLSENRREAVDGIVRLTELTDLLSSMKPPGSPS